MDIEFDHFFILTEKPNEAADILISMGLKESFSRDHKGQGTSNRRFEFSNGMLEILYVRDSEEADNGPAKDLKFTRRLKENASPFGVIFTKKIQSYADMPFTGWEYQPDYFPPPKAFHVGVNSKILQEPLCIYVPFVDPIVRKEDEGLFRYISSVKIYSPVKDFSEIVESLNVVDRIQFEKGSEDLAVLTLDGSKRGLTKDLRPTLPLIINW